MEAGVTVMVRGGEPEKARCGDGETREHGKTFPAPTISAKRLLATFS
jgi:hypothetical protein